MEIYLSSFMCKSRLVTQVAHKQNAIAEDVFVKNIYFFHIKMHAKGYKSVIFSII